jgi:ABC-type polysaccharide/polyol phosphate export permease
MQILIGVVNSLSFLVAFYFVSKMLTKTNIPSLILNNQNEYFLFVYIGFVSCQYFINPIAALNTNIRDAQMTGVLEHITWVGVPVYTYVIIHTVEDFLRTTFMIILYIIAGITIFGLDVKAFNFPILLIFFLLIVPFYYCFAVIVAELTLFFKEIGRIDFLVKNYIALFSGIFFSTKLLPFPIDIIKDVIPVYRCVDVARMIFIANVNYTELFYNIKIIAVYFLVFLFISIILMRKAAEAVKKDGYIVSP